MTDKNQHLLKRQRAFLKAYIECGGIISRAAIAAKTDRTNHYRWLAEEPDGDYAKAFALADEIAISGLEDEARFRAIEGLRKYKFTAKGQPVYVRCDKDHPEAFTAGEDDDGNPVFMRHYYEHDRSDTLLLALLNAAHPERFGRYRHEHRGKIEHEHSGAVQVYIPDNERGKADRLPPPPQRNGAVNGNGAAVSTNGNGHHNGNGKH